MSVRGRLKKEWKRRGYDTTLLASATIAPPPTEGFIRGYHLTSLDHGQSDVSHRRLKIARFSDLNDPFELIALNFHERNTRIAARMYKKDQHDRIGLLCFSTNWK